MKKLIYLLLLLPIWVSAQRTADQLPTGAGSQAVSWFSLNVTDTTNRQLWATLGAGKSSWIPTYRQMVNYVAAAGGTTIPAGPITSLPALAYNPGTNLTAGQWIQSVYYQSQPPTATLTGGISQERVTTGANLSATLNWSASRQAATQPLSSIVVATVAQTFSQPSAPGTVSGTQSVSYARNTTTSYSNVVTTTDSKTNTPVSTTFSFYDRGYAGYVTGALVSGNPSQSDILAAAIKDNSGGSTINTQVTAQQGSDQYYFFVTTTTRSSVSVNGTPSTASFNMNQPITFTNASGGTFNGYAHVSKFQIGSTGAITFVFN